MEPRLARSAAIASSSRPESASGFPRVRSADADPRSTDSDSEGSLPHQRHTYQGVVALHKGPGTLGRTSHLEKTHDDRSLPFLSSTQLNRETPLPKRDPKLPAINLVTDSPGLAPPKKGLQQVCLEAPNPRHSDDNQSGASVDSATRKRRLLAFNPIE